MASSDNFLSRTTLLMYTVKYGLLANSAFIESNVWMEAAGW